MKLNNLRSLDDMVAGLFRDSSPISAHVGPLSIKDEPVQPAEHSTTTTTTGPPVSVLDGLNLETAIRLRWVLRDIKAKRTGFLPIPQNDLMALIDLELVELRENTPILTDAGFRALNRS